MSLEGEERKEYILKALNSNGKIKVNLLAKELEVTAETIRRHLDELEREKLLKKVYGGAIKVSFAHEPPYEERTVYFTEEKISIGKKAAQLVKDNEVIIIDVGTTTLQMVKYILDIKNLTIITSSIAVLETLINYRNNNVFTGRIVFIGGEINPEQLTVSGNLSESFMANFYADKAFISLGGISMDGGLTGYDMNECALTRKVIQHAKQSIALLDHSKIGIRSYYKIADMEDIDAIICDTEVPAEWKDKLSQKDVEWICAKNGGSL